MDPKFEKKKRGKEQFPLLINLSAVLISWLIYIMTERGKNTL